MEHPVSPSTLRAWRTDTLPPTAPSLSPSSLGGPRFCFSRIVTRTGEPRLFGSQRGDHGEISSRARLKNPASFGSSPTNLQKLIHPGIILFTVTPSMRKDVILIAVRRRHLVVRRSIVEPAPFRRKGMTDRVSRRQFLQTTGGASAALLLSAPNSSLRSSSDVAPAETADYTLHIKAAPIEIAPKSILSTVTYNGQFPGPLLRFKEGSPTIVDVFNDTDTPEQLHWHGQRVSTDVDGAAEEGTPPVPAHGMRRLSF